MENERSAGSGREPSRPGDSDTTSRLKDRAGVAGSLVSTAVGLASLVQTVRSDPLWILLGVVALVGLLAYQLRRRHWRWAGLAALGLLLLGSIGWVVTHGATTTDPGGAGNPAASVLFSDVVQLDKKTGVDLDAVVKVTIWRQ